jgi:hypothetical protein
MTIRNTIILLLAAITLASCIGAPKITRRYGSRTFNPGLPAIPDVTAPTVNVFVLDVPRETAQTTLRDLSAEAQAALIQEMGRLSKSPQELVQNLARPLRASTSPGGLIDETRRRKRLVFSVTNNSRLPGTRIQRIDMGLKQVYGAQLTSWNMFATEFGTIDLGSVNAEQNRSLSASASADPRGPLFGTQNLSAATSGKLSEAILLRERYIKSSGILQANSARIIQQGVPGIDLAGNLTVDLDFRINPPYARHNVYLLGGTDAEPTITRVTRIFPQKAVEVVASPDFCAEIRGIAAKDRTLMEGDDKAQFEKVCASATAVRLYGSLRVNPSPVTNENAALTLLTEDESLVTVWVLRHGTLGLVHVVNSPNEVDPLFFLNEADADRALEHLLKLKPEQPITLGGRQLVFQDLAGKRNLTRPDIDSLLVFVEEKN